MERGSLSSVLDSLNKIGIYVVEADTHRILYFNRWIQKITPEVKLGMKCHEIWKMICPSCLLDEIGEHTSNHTLHYNTSFGSVVDVVADKTIWNEDIPAYIVTVMPHKQSFEETLGSGRIGEMYAKSLVTVFSECVLVNLTADYYVNCQKDRMWTNIPESGPFEEENLHYASITIYPDDLEQFHAYFSRKVLLEKFEEGRIRVSRRMRRLMNSGEYHMVEFTAARIESSDGDCWCVLVFQDVNEEYLMEKRRNTEMSQLATAVRNAYDMLVMNGYEAARKIRSSGLEGIEELPIVAMTADAFTEDVKKSRLAGMSGHLSKPIFMDELNKTLSDCIKWEEKNRRKGRKPMRKAEKNDVGEMR